MANMAELYYEMDYKIKEKTNWSICDFLILLGCICVGLLMIVRCFYSTEITDEAYYVADAKAMLEGNLPYAYCTYSYGSGSCFLLIPFIALYRIFRPELTGVFLYSRLCFVLMWYAVLFVIYKILRKDVRRGCALFFVGVLIPYKPGLVLWNFSYNTVPSALMLLTAFLLYDAVENKSRLHVFEICISGFISAIAFFAQPGYGLAIVIFGIILLVRSRGKKSKIQNICFYGIGGIAEVCAVYVPIFIQVGIATTWAGVSRYFNGYPSNTNMSLTTPASRALGLVFGFRQFVVMMILGTIIIYIVVKRYVRENEQNLSRNEYCYMSIITAGCLLVFSFFKSCTSTDGISYMLGMVGTIILCGLFVLRVYKKDMLLIYVGVYPILFAAGEAIMVDSGSTVERFTAVVPTMAICLLFFMKERSEIIRLLAAATAALCALELGLNVWSYVYRDEELAKLQYRVEEGVYKGLYTTSARANDLPKLERYLNQYIEEGEYYEFHDLAPFGYLMMHTGQPCSIATWDSLNYSYGKDAPAELYEYYRRRQAIPNKIFYVDYGRDEKLSIEKSTFKYNEFIKTYYDKIDEIKMNGTFRHIIVYEYKGGFDGNYGYWIDRHMFIPGK